VGLDDDGASSGQRGCGVAAGHREREGEVACAEHRDRAERDEHPAQVGQGAHGGVDGVVHGGLEVGTIAEDVGEQA